MSSSFGNLSSSIPGMGCSNLDSVSGDVNNKVLNSVANSGPSVGASSLMTTQHFQKALQKAYLPHSQNPPVTHLLIAIRRL